MQKVQMEDLENIQFISSPEFNQDGKWLAFIRTQANLEDNDYQSDVWLYDVEKKASWQLTASEEVTGFAWLNESNLVFKANRKAKDKEKAKKEEFTNIYRIYIHGGEAVKLFKVPALISGFTMLDDETCLFLMESDLHGKNLFDLKKD